MAGYDVINGLSVDRELVQFIEREALPGIGLDPQSFWSGFAEIMRDLAPLNRLLLDKRERMQREIDAWHRARAGKPVDQAAYRTFLTEIGYLVPEGDDFSVGTRNVDDEIARVAGPQLVVPLMNARYSLNAANARWGSLYDALYGTDAIPATGETVPGYDPVRGQAVIDYARKFLDEAAALAEGRSHRDVVRYSVSGGEMQAELNDGASVGLQDAAKFAGYRGDAGSPTSVLLINNNLHLEICIDPTTVVGKSDPTGVSDLRVEAAPDHDHGLRRLHCRR